MSGGGVTPNQLNQLNQLAEFRASVGVWAMGRAQLAAAEESGDYPDPDDWQTSDDWAVLLLQRACALLGVDVPDAGAWQV